MDNLIKISVIIPVYNVEDFLVECLDSVVNQTLNDIEILCINDGSTDNSLNILKQYSDNDSRIRIINQENKGQGAARNLGIELSSGKYIYFMDSDDFLELTALEELYNIAEENEVDIVIFKLINYNQDNKEISRIRYYEMKSLKNKVKNSIFNFWDVPEFLFKIAVSPPGKLFKRELITDIKFPEGYIFEDNVFFIEAFLNSKSNIFYDKHLYFRRLHSDSTMTKQDRFSDAIIISNMVYDLLKEYNAFEYVGSEFYSQKFRKLHYRYFQVTDERIRDDFFIKLKKDFISKQNMYKMDDLFYDVPKSLNKFFNWIITIDDRKFFDLKMLNSDLIDKNNKLVEQEKINKISIKKIKLEKNSLSREYRHLEKKYSKLNKDFEKLKLENEYLKDDFNNLKNKKREMDIKLKNTEKENMKLNSDLSKIKKINSNLEENNYNLNKRNLHFKSTKAYKIWIKYVHIKEKIIK